LGSSPKSIPTAHNSENNQITVKGDYMKLNEKIKRLKAGCYIKYSEINYVRRIFLYTPDGSCWIASLNIKEFESMLSKGLIKLKSKDDSSMSHPNRTIQLDIRIYVWSSS
jgi:hypothetical protein